ncbi:MAG: ankyrin repeat domain-containing protein [Leptospiraceae bacterium]|nr:ankyrin repeat domain-containing protein [Leptospiraceae bacterium]MDW8306088.1 ankyrin repeat domain-containing protein [Leptospiraceae bacterium]
MDLRNTLLFLALVQVGFASSADKLLYEAVWKRDLQKAKEAVARGANVNYKTPYDEDFPLGIAAYLGDLRMVLFLLNMGAHVNLAKKGGWNALMAAADEGHLKIVQLLITKGAAVDSKTAMGRSVLMRAAYQGQTEIVRYLLRQGANPNAQDNEGTTALMLAAQNGHEDVVHLLLARGARVELVNQKGKRAIDYAREYVHKHYILMGKEYRGRLLELLGMEKRKTEIPKGKGQEKKRLYF